jgi:glucokinase
MRIGIDIGGTKAQAIALDDAGAVLADVRLPSGHGEPEVLQNARSSILQLAELVPDRIESVGIGIPGNVDFATGVVSHAVNLGISELALAAGVADLVDGPVRVDNDVNAAALGAHEYLGAHERRDVPHSVAYLNIGTGIAAGLVLKGDVHRGDRNIAGEVGHFPRDSAGPLCICGQRGCLETVASGTAIAARWAGSTSFPEGVLAGDPAALRLRESVADGIADAVQLLLLVVGVERIVLGGGVIQHVPGVVASLRRSLESRADASAFLASLGMAERVESEPAGASIAARGAALLPHAG